jgi:Tfp pilus assembly protein PilE
MRGQASVEWIVILSMAILILAIMLSFNENNYQSFRDNVRVSKAKATLNDLENAVDFVYSQGEGAKTRLHITLPEASNFSVATLSTGKGRIQGIVYVRGEEEYFDAYTDANLTGSLPSEAGGYCVDVEYVNAKVNITRSGGSC